MVLVERKTCRYVANAFLIVSELIWSISKPKISKMSKKCVFGDKHLESLGQETFFIVSLNNKICIVEKNHKIFKVQMCMQAAVG